MKEKVMKEVTNTQKLFAIWKYDNPPYYLGGVVKEIQDGGLVSVEGYEPMRFVYHKLYPIEEGRNLYTQLQNAKIKYQLAEKKAHEELMKTVEKLVPKNIN